MRGLLTLLALLALLVFPAQAAGLEEAAGVEEFRRASESYLEGYLDMGEVFSGDFAAGAGAILDTGSGALPGILRRAGRSGALLLAVTLLCALSETLREELGGGGLDPIHLAGAAAVTAIAVVDVNALLGLGLMLSAGEVPRIAGAFGLDTSTKASLTSAVHTAQMAVSTTKVIASVVGGK